MYRRTPWKLRPIPAEQAFSLNASERASFAGKLTPCRISGPPSLVRLVQRGRPHLGRYWFEERTFHLLREKAKIDLLDQQRSNQTGFRNDFDSLVGMYMKHCLRQDLAICKNWTEEFDAYVVLPLYPSQEVIGWVGRIKDQPYYARPNRTRYPDSGEYERQLKIYERAEAGGVSLIAKENQFLIDFRHPMNRAAAFRVQGPWNF